MKKLYLLTLLSILSIIPAPARADEKLATKESLIAAWEINIKNLPTTKIFEKQSDGVYKFETTLIPYKGEIKIHNVIVDKDIDLYSDYRLDDEGLIKGVVEAAIVGPKEKCDLFPIGCRALESYNTLYYSDSSNSWLREKEMIAVVEAKEDAEEAQSSSAPKSKTNSADLVRYMAIAFLSFFALSSLLCNRRQKEHIKKYKERSNKSIELQEGGIAQGRESIALQEEGLNNEKQIIELLKQILEKK